MADLAIRNCTATALELKLVERFEGQPSKQNRTCGNIASKLVGIFNSSTSVAPLVDAQGDVEGYREVSISIDRFEARTTDIRAPDPGREVIRLVFECEGYRYQVDAPNSSRHSNVMKKLDDGPHDFTVVYVLSGACLAVFSSAHLASWMRGLRDEWPLSALSIPGTHNSATCHVALPSVRCQAVSIREQLDNGVRFFDIRVSVDSKEGNSDLALVHSAFPISLTGTKYFHDMLADVYAFLDDNPSETLVMSIKREGTGRGNDQKLSRHLRERYCAPDNPRWFTQPQIPSLGEARGKVVLFRRYANDQISDGEYGGRGFGLDASAWPDNCANDLTGPPGIARVQDFYEVTQSHNIQKKIEMSRAHLERAAAIICPALAKPEIEHKPFHVNFLSGSNFFNANCWPEKIAAKANPAIIEYLSLRHAAPGKGPAGSGVGDGATGIVVTDWVGLDGDWDLIRCIVGWNARLQLKQ